jgi:hypothetical protein
MQLNQHNKFVRTILRIVDVLLSFLGGTPVHWNEDPYTPADQVERRKGWFIVAIVPFITIFFMRSKSVESFLNSTSEGHLSVIWLYVMFIGICALGVLGLWVVGPKVPAYLSIPIGIAGWVLCAWMFGFHSDNTIN